jgi:hypothetical protein
MRGRLIYNLDTRCFLRAFAQYRDIGRNPAMYDDPVATSSHGLFTQLLFS